MNSKPTPAIVNRKFFFLLFFMFVSATTLAQQLQLTSQYQLHNFMYNAGAAGMSGRTEVGISYRSQWSGMPGAPLTAMAYFSGFWKKMDLGFGGYLYNDKTGPTTRTGLQSAFAYHVRVGQKSKIGVGIEMRVLQYSINKAKLIEALGYDPVLAGSSNRIRFDAGAGVYYNNEKLSIGLAVSQLMQSALNLTSVSLATDRAKFYRHYYGMASYQWQTDESTMIIPNAMVVYLPNAPTEYFLGFKVIHSEAFWWGLNHHIDQGWSIQAGYIHKKDLFIGYAYDIYRTPLSQYYTGSGAHEVMIRYYLSKKKI